MMSQMWKTVSTGLSLLALVSCTSAPTMNITAWRIRNAQAALHRTRSGAEFSQPLSESEGYYCFKPGDVEAILIDLEMLRSRD